jgi:hypothetical protein
MRADNYGIIVFEQREYSVLGLRFQLFRPGDQGPGFSSGVTAYRGLSPQASLTHRRKRVAARPL